MKLFESTSYNNEINKICSAGYKLDEPKEMVFHPLQINIVMMPPGQDLPLHQVTNRESQSGIYGPPFSGTDLSKLVGYVELE